VFGALPAVLARSLQELTGQRMQPARADQDASAAHATQSTHADHAAHAALIAQAMALGYANGFDAMDARLPYRPVLADGTGLHRHPRATAPGSQSAIVVGPDGSSTPQPGQDVYCDRLGRIRIRFHWQGPHDDAAASCWVRVAQRAASAGMGWQFLPRIGQEVLVKFVEGDIDRPIVVGALYNGQGEGGVPITPGGINRLAGSADPSVFDQARDHRPSAQGNLASGHGPAWHGAAGSAQRNLAALWGVRSQEWSGRGHNELVFDDSDSQGRLRLRTTQAATALQLGHLIHNADNYRGSFRGTGAELRTDAWGAVRAGAGLLITSYPLQHSASTREPAGDNAPGMALLRQANSMAASLHEAAVGHRTVGLGGHTGSVASGTSLLNEQAAPLPALHTALSGMVEGSTLEAARTDAASHHTGTGAGKLPHTGGPVAAISARGGLAAAAGQGLHLALGETLSIMSGGDSQVSSGGAVRLHAGQGIGLLGGAARAGKDGRGLDIVAGKGMVDVQAQDGPLSVQAKGLVDIRSAHAHIDWAAAKKISLSTAGGANITIEGGNITVQCPGKLTVQASEKRFAGPTNMSYALPSFPSSAPVCVECLIKALKSGAPVAVV
jgi:uncharacterized protein (DUF2345 family)